MFYNIKGIVPLPTCGFFSRCTPVSRHQHDDGVLDLVILDVDSSGGLDEKALAIRIKALGPKPP
jgi:hypothetical protein